MCAEMSQLRDILLHMDTRQADIFVRQFFTGKTFSVNMNPPVQAERHVILGKLIVLRHIGIEIALAVEFAPLLNVAGTHEAGGDNLADRLFIRSRQNPGISHADGTDQCIGFRSELIRAGTEHFAFRTCLNMHLKTDYSFICRHNFLLLDFKP